MGAGRHTVEAEYAGDSNYAAGSGSYTQVVNQAPLSIVPDNLSRSVGQPNPRLTYSFTGFVNGQNAGTAGITGSANLATTATISSPAGLYAITVTNAGTLSAANYDFPAADFRTGTLTVTPSGGTDVVIASPPSSTHGQSVSFTVKGSTSRDQSRFPGFVMDRLRGNRAGFAGFATFPMVMMAHRRTIVNQGERKDGHREVHSSRSTPSTVSSPRPR